MLDIPLLTVGEDIVEFACHIYNATVLPLAAWASSTESGFRKTLLTPQLTDEDKLNEDYIFSLSCQETYFSMY